MSVLASSAPGLLHESTRPSDAHMPFDALALLDLLDSSRSLPGYAVPWRILLVCLMPLLEETFVRILLFPLILYLRGNLWLRENLLLLRILIILKIVFCQMAFCLSITKKCCCSRIVPSLTCRLFFRPWFLNLGRLI